MFNCWGFLEVVKLNIGRDFEATFGQYFWILILVELLMFGWDFEISAWLRFWRWNLTKICVWTCLNFSKKNSTLGSVVPLAMFTFRASFKSETFLFVRGLEVNKKLENILIKDIYQFQTQKLCVPLKCLNFWCSQYGTDFWIIQVAGVNKEEKPKIT